MRSFRAKPVKALDAAANMHRQTIIFALRREVAGLGIKYPVVTDQDYSTWKAYRVEAWPTLFLLDKQGRVRWTHVGEGHYDETEEVIKKLLTEEVLCPKLTDGAFTIRPKLDHSFL